MTDQEIVARLSERINPSEVVYAITARSILSAIARRLGEEALTLSEEDLRLALDEVKAALDHNLDEREYIDMGLDAWEIVRNLQ